MEFQDVFIYNESFIIIVILMDLLYVMQDEVKMLLIMVRVRLNGCRMTGLLLMIYLLFCIFLDLCFYCFFEVLKAVKLSVCSESLPFFVVMSHP